MTVTDDERRRLTSVLLEFDPSDDFHSNAPIHEESVESAYYAALDRAILLINGEINDWTDPRP